VGLRFFAERVMASSSIVGLGFMGLFLGCFWKVLFWHSCIVVATDKSKRCRNSTAFISIVCWGLAS